MGVMRNILGDDFLPPFFMGEVLERSGGDGGGPQGLTP